MPRKSRTARPSRSTAGTLLEAMEGRTLLSTYYVTNTNDGGSGSLRQAILNANNHYGADVINFKIGSGAKTIMPKSSLPAMSGPTVLDATTQPGYAGKPLIELNGSYAGSGANGLKTTGGSTTIKGFAINRFKGSGIFLYSKGNNKIQKNFIGTDRNGTIDYGNAAHGIIVQSSGNTIGGTYSSDRNVISGNGEAGVFFYLNAGSHNKVQGNYIGTDISGTKKIANKNGVHVNSGQYNVIGGTTAGARNVLSGNIHDGVLIYGGGAKYNQVQGNYIGTNAAGTAKLGNGWYGVEISQSYNTVGGTTSGHRNVISGNGHDGVAIYLSSGTNNKIEGNYIGTDYTGTRDLGNVGAGVCFTNEAKNNIVGGSTAAHRNIIAGNDLYGVGVYNHAHYNRIEGNRIGISAGGKALPNTKNPISIWISNYTTIKNNSIVNGTGAATPIMVSGGMTTYQSGNTIGVLPTNTSTAPDTSTDTGTGTSGKISGVLYSDDDQDGALDSSDKRLGGRKMYIDANKNGRLDSGEKTSTTNSNGEFAFSSLASGSYRIRRADLPAGYGFSTPSSGYYDVSLASNQQVSGKNFGAIPITGDSAPPPSSVTTGGRISGVLFDDLDRDGNLDSSDKRLAARKMYIDANKNGQLDSGEKTATTGSTGEYVFSGLVSGSYRIRRADLPGGFKYSTPSSGYHDTVLSSNQAISGRNFGVVPA